MPFSLCDASLDLTEATHVILAHPYMGPDTAAKYGSFPPSYRPKEKEWADAKRAGWSGEQWRVERLKWREVERRAVACIVRGMFIFLSFFHSILISNEGYRWTNSVGPCDVSLRGAHARGRDCAQLWEPAGISCGRPHDRRSGAGHAGSVPQGLDWIGCGSVG
ncbi:hypothetical protein BC828DRAFT_382337 [Blastocladiella britannica]|nr:hypothetical protein BC828DRAFT_382337 [Blastocladiella britannica]